MNEDEFYEQPKPTWVKPCERCGEEVSRYRGDGDVVCRSDYRGDECRAIYNAGGQRLRDDAPTFGVGGYWGPTPWDDYDDAPVEVTHGPCSHPLCDDHDY